MRDFRLSLCYSGFSSLWTSARAQMISFRPPRFTPGFKPRKPAPRPALRVGVIRSEWRLRHRSFIPHYFRPVGSLRILAQLCQLPVQDICVTLAASETPRKRRQKSLDHAPMVSQPHLRPEKGNMGRHRRRHALSCRGGRVNRVNRPGSGGAPRFIVTIVTHAAQGDEAFAVAAAAFKGNSSRLEIVTV